MRSSGTCARRGRRVGVISVDPSSPFTQGALLGDRIRLTEHFLDPDVFIRSMGTRGHLGGLAEATLQALLMLDAAGKDVVFLETVGHRAERGGVISIADTVVLVLMPGSGDSIQALKAGIMEIPDVIASTSATTRSAKTMLNEVRAGALARPDARVAAADRAHRGAARRGHRRALGADRASTAPASRQRASSRSAGAGTSPREVFAVASARARRHLEEAVARRSGAAAAPRRGRARASSTR